MTTAYNVVGRRCAVMFLLALLLVLVLPTTVYADGLFNFQMKLAKRGNAEAQYKVGEMYDTGFGVKKNRAEAEKWITKAAGKGNEKAGFKLLYWDVEKNGLKGDNKVKVDALVNKADAGNSQAQYFVGKMHANGIGVKKDSNKAIGWLNKAAFSGVLDAERELAVVRENKQNQALSKRRAQLKTDQERAKKERVIKEKTRKEKAKLAQQQRMSEAKREAEAKVKANAAAKKKADAIEQSRQEEAKLMAQQKADAAKKAAASEAAAKQREVEKQALLKKQAEAKKRISFESDPCKGKSARFLSTCR